MTRSTRELAGAVVVGAQRRFRARRHASRRRVLRLAATVVVLLGLVLGIGWVALNSSLVEVRTVTVEGTSRLSVAQVLAAADVRRGESLFRLDPAEVAARVRRLPPVSSVEVSRRWPHGVVVRVTERRPVASVASGGATVLFDRTGTPFATVASPPRGLMAVTVEAAVPGPGTPAARAAVAVLESLPDRLRHRVTGLHAASATAVSFRLRDGRLVTWGSATAAARKAAVLQALLHRRATSYDVSNPAVAVTR